MSRDFTLIGTTDRDLMKAIPNPLPLLKEETDYLPQRGSRIFSASRYARKTLFVRKKPPIFFRRSAALR